MDPAQWTQSRDLSPMITSKFETVPEKYQKCDIGAASGKHKWNDLYYFGALAASRHATTHIFSGIVATTFGAIVLQQRPFQWMFGEGIIAGGIFLICGLCCIVCCSPKTSGKHLHRKTFNRFFDR